jgi:hypothetical protein
MYRSYGYESDRQVLRYFFLCDSNPLSISFLNERVKFNFFMWLLSVLYTLAKMFCYIDIKAIASRA